MRYTYKRSHKGVTIALTRRSGKRRVVTPVEEYTTQQEIGISLKRELSQGSTGFLYHMSEARISFRTAADDVEEFSIEGDAAEIAALCRRYLDNYNAFINGPASLIATSEEALPDA